MREKMCISTVFIVLILFLTCCQMTMSRTQNNSSPIYSVKQSTNQDILNLPVSGKVDGEQMKAFLAAHDVFQIHPQIPGEKKRIENYFIEFRKQDETFFILFFAKQTSSESNLDGGETELGKDVMFTVTKKDYRVIRSQFFK